MPFYFLQASVPTPTPTSGDSGRRSKCYFWGREVRGELEVSPHTSHLLGQSSPVEVSHSNADGVEATVGALHGGAETELASLRAWMATTTEGMDLDSMSEEGRLEVVELFAKLEGAGSSLLRVLPRQQKKRGPAWRSVSAGRGYSILITETGGLYGFGVDEHETPKPITRGLVKVQVVQVASGQQDFLLLSDFGEVFRFREEGGGGEDGAAERVNGLRGVNVKQVSSGAHHLALDVDGNVYTWGAQGEPSWFDDQIDANLIWEVK